MEPINAKACELMERRENASKRLLDAARVLELLLRDLNHHNSADRIAAILGEIDAVDAESRAWFTDNKQAIAFELLLQAGFPPKRA